MNKFAFSIFLFVLGFLGRILAGSIFCGLTFELKCDSWLFSTAAS